MKKSELKGYVLHVWKFCVQYYLYTEIEKNLLKLFLYKPTGKFFSSPDLEPNVERPAPRY